MFVRKSLLLALAILWSTVCVLCSYGPSPCTEPEVRREWRAFSTKEKAEWIRAIKCLSKLPHDPAMTPSVDPSVSLIPPLNTSSSYYDDLVYLHMDLNIRIHGTGQFLPWHRWYVHVFEESLKKKCGYTGTTPYWDWTIDSPNFYDSPFWKDANPKSGLGGWGDPKADYSVPDGAFHTLPLSYPLPHIVRRNFSLSAPPFPGAALPPGLSPNDPSLFSASEVESVLETTPGDFKQFQIAIGVPHGAIHGIVGGDLFGGCPTNAPSNCTPGPKWAPNDPLFYMHHGTIDKIWSDWQNRNPASASSFFGGSSDNAEFPTGGPPYLSLDSIIPTDGLFPEVTIGDVLSTTGGYLCYVYE
ncbi:Di-copper centre-containing protein [Russula aff. rugulosa BPL654]|nr:Di-copper centre-containing protein [Russula aff. rugulosa BPL654]